MHRDVLWLILVICEAVVIVVQSSRLAFYKGYFNQQQKNRKMIEDIKRGL